MTTFDADNSSTEEAAEVHTEAVVWTLDADFRVYRRHGRQAIPTLMPHDDD